MQKETVLAKIRVHMNFNQKTLVWFEKIKKLNLWFAQELGIPLLSEYRGTWNELLISTVEPEIQKYFIKLGMPEDKLPRVKVYESYAGSWIIEAAVTMFASIGTAYTILKGISELPKIQDGLNELKQRLKKEFSKKADEKATKYIESSIKQYQLPSPPKQLIDCDFTIDARPLLSLTATLMKTHKVHLNVAISRDAFTLENLGDELMRNIIIGIFKSSSQRNQWTYGDSFKGSIDILSSKQTITKDIPEFKDNSGNSLDLSDNSPLHIDCWVQDNYGIYLFMFFLEEK
jgi:hypothetical protein